MGTALAGAEGPHACLAPEFPMTAVLHLPFIEVASACATACHHCAATCLGADEPKPMAQCIALSIDCAAMCQLAAAAVARGSEVVKVLATACAAVCDRCAAECALHATTQCQRCAEACRRCAHACREMAAA